MRRSSFGALFLITFALGFGHSTGAHQSRATFEKAIANQSTAPSYVLVTVINDKTRTRQTICTTSNFLLGAIHSQYHLPYTDEGLRKGNEIALASKDETFHFSQADALRNLSVRYTPQILARVRDHLRNVSALELVRGLSYNGKYHQIYEKYKSFRMFAAYRDALAYVLLERGLRPGQGDISGGIYLSP